MADTSPRRSGWTFRPVPPEQRSIVELITTGTLDAELAATLEGVMTRLIGHVPRSTRFLAQTRRTLTAHP